MLRRLISMTLASCLALFGIGGLVAFIVGTLQGYGGRVIVGAVAGLGFVGALGLLWLWEDINAWRERKRAPEHGSIYDDP